MAAIRHHVDVQQSLAKLQPARPLTRVPLTLAIDDADPIPAVALELGQHGALILSPVPVSFPAAFWMRNKMTRAIASVRVVRPCVVSRTAVGYEILVEFIDPDVSIPTSPIAS